MSFKSSSEIYSKSKDKYNWVSTSYKEPFAIYRKCIVSLLDCLPQPSAIFEGTETAHLLI